MRMTRLNGLTLPTLLVAGSLGACQAERIEAIGRNTGNLEDGVCKTRDEIPPPLIHAPNGGACPAVGSDCKSELPVSFCHDGERRFVLTCDAATKSWKVMFKECPSESGAPSSGGTPPPPSSNGSSSEMCKPRDQIPPPLIDAPNGGACPAVGSDCKNVPPVSFCNDGERRMVLTCDAATKTWQVAFKECPPEGTPPPPSSNGSSSATCKPRSEIPPPVIDAPNGGACPAVGSDCKNAVPITICTDGERRVVLTCDAATKTWRVLLKECPADGGAPAS